MKRAYLNIPLFRFVLWLHLGAVILLGAVLYVAARWFNEPLIIDQESALAWGACLILPLIILPFSNRLAAPWAWRIVEAGFAASSFLGLWWLFSAVNAPVWMSVAALAFPILEGVVLFSPSGILVTLAGVVLLVAAAEVVTTHGSPDIIQLLLRTLYVLGVTFFASVVIGYFKRLETGAQTHQSDTQAVLESMKDGLLVVDSSNRLNYLNPKAASYLGADTKKLLGKQMEEKQLIKDGFESLAAVLFYSDQSKKENNEGEINEVVIEKPQTKILRVTSVPVRGADGRLQGFSHLLQDVTDERTLAQTKTAFIAILSHSLRTPLNGIKWALESLTKEKLSPAEQQPIFEQISSQENMMENMVEGLVLASEIQKGEMSYKMEKIDLADVVRAAASFHAAEAKKKKLSFTVSVGKGAVYLKADRTKLKIALSNIIANAVKYTEKGAVSVSLAQSRQGAAVTVTDTGIGIPKEQLGRLFSQFFWAKNAIMHQHEGAGMGLYITKQIVDKHNGKITISSEPDRGTTVTVMFKT